jgi:hypothetical protein
MCASSPRIRTRAATGPMASGHRPLLLHTASRMHQADEVANDLFRTEALASHRREALQTVAIATATAASRLTGPAPQRRPSTLLTATPALLAKRGAVDPQLLRLRGECRVIFGVTVVTTLVCFFILHTRLRAQRAPREPILLRRMDLLRAAAAGRARYSQR